MSELKKYRVCSKPIEAIQFTGDNLRDIERICGEKCVGARFCGHQCIEITIETFDGWCDDAKTGDYIVKTSDGFLVYTKSIFEKIYEETQNVEMQNLRNGVSTNKG